MVLGWRPEASASIAAVAIVTLVGAAASAGLGLLIAGTLRPEAALVFANVLFLIALGLSGAVVPLDELPATIAAIAGVLPFGALGEAFAAALGTSADLLRPLGVLSLWAVAALVAAARTFHWD